MNKGLWLSKDTGSFGEGDMTCDDSSRVESKRSHQWFMEGTEPDFLHNKKQAVELLNETSFSQLLNSSVSTWGNPSSFQSVTGQFPERLFDSEPARTLNFDDNMNIGLKPNENSFGSFGLSMSHSTDDQTTGLSYGGIRKVKVNQVKDSESFMSVPSDNSITTGLSFNIGDANMISMGDACNRENDSFISMGQPCNRVDNIEISMGLIENSGGILMDQASRVHPHNKVDDNMVSMANNSLSMSQSFSKGDSNIISFGGLNDNDLNSSGRLFYGYDLLRGQSSVQGSDALSERDLIELNCDSILRAAQISGSGEFCSKKKDEEKSSKKAPPNNFPSNVRSLLSTGMLDGVPVKYIAWSREKELRGLIKGSAYLCGCQSCSFSKAINAYEFERHAGCKTKHPNNHIYFENGKTVYGIVQELRSTPQNLLFEVIQTITGSPINQKSFRLWKESFVAATRELQRIYGKDEGLTSELGSLEEYEESIHAYPNTRKIRDGNFKHWKVSSGKNFKFEVVKINYRSTVYKYLYTSRMK